LYRGFQTSRATADNNDIVLEFMIASLKVHVSSFFADNDDG